MFNKKSFHIKINPFLLRFYIILNNPLTTQSHTSQSLGYLMVFTGMWRHTDAQETWYNFTDGSTNKWTVDHVFMHKSDKSTNVFFLTGVNHRTLPLRLVDPKKLQFLNNYLRYLYPRKSPFDFKDHKRKIDVLHFMSEHWIYRVKYRNADNLSINWLPNSKISIFNKKFNTFDNIIKLKHMILNTRFDKNRLSFSQWL